MALKKNKVSIDESNNNIKVVNSKLKKNNNTKKITKIKKNQIIEAEIIENDDKNEEDEENESNYNNSIEYDYVNKDDFENEEPNIIISSEISDDISDDISDEEIISEKSLVVVSGLQRYLSEIRKYPLLNREQEKELAHLAYEKGDKIAKQKLVTSNLRLVVKIAMEYRRVYSQILDLIQEGNAGLVQAVNRFNPYKNVKLSTYGALWIRAYILKFLMDNKSLVRMGTTDAQRKLFFKLQSEAQKMYALTQKYDVKLLAENIGVKETDVIEMQTRLNKSDLSLDTPIGDENDTRQIDILPSNYLNPEEQVSKNNLQYILKQELNKIETLLNERDLFIFKNRIIAEDPITLQDVGAKFGITRERARQLEARVLKLIKEHLIIAGFNKEDTE